VSKPTPGPWTYQATPESSNQSYIVSAPEGRVASLWSEANARLIAAAPSLLEACKDYHAALDMAFALLIESKPYFYPSKSEMWAAMVAGNEAIRKAEGQ